MAFLRNSKSISANSSISFYNSMTRYLRSIRVSSQCLPCSLSTPTSDEISENFVGRHFPQRNHGESYIYFLLKKCRHIFVIRNWLIRNFSKVLFSPRHSIEIKPLLVNHRLGMKIFLFSFLEKSPLINNPSFEECWKTLWNKLFLWPILLIFEVMFPFFKGLITPSLPIFTSHKNLKSSFFHIFREAASFCLCFDDWSFESVFICHMLIWYENEKKINAKRLLSLLNYTASNCKNISSVGYFWSWKIKCTFH